MAKFKASPFYSVYVPSGKINFDHKGEYETTNAGDVAVLKSLCPRYLICTDEGKANSTKTEKPEAKAPTRKPSAK